MSKARLKLTKTNYMGIDIYAEWRQQTEDEKKKQYTGFSVTSGDSGYLREAYHGGPYVTKYLVQEAFTKENPARISASVLRERLPIAVLMSLYRDKKVYGQKDPMKITDLEKGLQQALTKVFAIELKDDSHESFAREVKPEQIFYINEMISRKMIPDFAQAFVDFVELCEKQEKLLGEPCSISASY